MTELRAALHEAVESAPGDALDLTGVISAGNRRVRRRRVVASAAACLVAAVVVSAVAVPGSDKRDDAPEPAKIDLDSARTVDSDVVASTRSNDPGESESFLGITADGLVLRTGFDADGRLTRVGTLDVDSGSTSWFPPAPVVMSRVLLVELGSDRLVFLEDRLRSTKVLVTYDRATRTWRRQPVLLEGSNRHMTVGTVIGTDGRVYLSAGNTGPLVWWSFALDGSDPRAEPTLMGKTLAWQGDTRVTGAVGGDLTFTRPGEEPVETAPPDGCVLRTTENATPPRLEVAGSQLVVSYWCADETRTVVYDESGSASAEIEGDAFLYAVDARFVVLSSDSRTYVLDLASNELLGLDPDVFYIRGPARAMTAGGLLLLGLEGPRNSNTEMDVISRVVRLPVEGAG